MQIHGLSWEVSMSCVLWYRAAGGPKTVIPVPLLLCHTISAVPGKSRLCTAAQSDSALEPHCQRLLFSIISLPLWLCFFCNFGGMPDKTWVCRQEPKVECIGFLRAEHRAKSPAVGAESEMGFSVQRFPGAFGFGTLWC